MRKVILGLAVAGTAIAAAAPAAAQYYPAPPAPPPVYGQGYGQPYGQGYGLNWLFDFRNQRYARMMQDRVSRIRHDVRQMGAQRILSWDETRSLDNQARNLQDRIFRYSRYGVTQREARQIDRQVRRLEERVIREANDWNRRSGVRRYNPWNYNQYWNQYGPQGYSDYDRDGRNDRYEDDRGRRHD